MRNEKEEKDARKVKHGKKRSTTEMAMNKQGQIDAELEEEQGKRVSESPEQGSGKIKEKEQHFQNEHTQMRRQGQSNLNQH